MDNRAYRLKLIKIGISALITLEVLMLLMMALQTPPVVQSTRSGGRVVDSNKYEKIQDVSDLVLVEEVLIDKKD